jgi:translation initiation factor RLI1
MTYVAQVKLQEMGVPKMNVSYKPQKISPKFEGTGTAVN